MYLNVQPIVVLTKFSLHQIQVRYRYLSNFRYQFFRPPLTMGQGGLLLRVGEGKVEVRYRTSFLIMYLENSVKEPDYL
jgi:hypothetical protein